MQKQYFLLFVIGVLLAGLATAACDVLTTETACGATIDSDLGQGAVSLCDTCYPCGVADNVCPEDYFDGTRYANCSNCVDPDCLTTLEGRVYRKDNPALGIRQANITAQILHVGDWATRFSATTLNNGNYTLIVPAGNYKISAEAAGFDTRIVDFPLARGEPYVLNISLVNGSCHTDCSGYLYDDGTPPLCKASCEGFGDQGEVCRFDSRDIDGTIYNAMNYCDGVPLGAKRVISTDRDMSWVVECCSGIITQETRPQVIINQDLGNIKNLVSKTLIAQDPGEATLVKVKILIYDK